MSQDIRFYVTDWGKKPWAYKQGWLYYERNRKWVENPHNLGSSRYNLFNDGYDEAEFYAKVDGGYYDWA